MSTNSRRIGSAIGDGLDWLLVATLVMLLVALAYEPIREKGLIVFGIPLMVATAAAILSTWFKS